MKKLLFAAMIAVVGLSACKKEDPQPENPSSTPTPVALYTLGTKVTTNNETVVLYADNANLRTAYTPIYVQIKDANGNIKEDATVSVMPLMDMTSMSHSSPIETVVYDATSKTYKGAIVFTMASGSMGSWTVKVTVNGEELTFPVTVDAAATKVVGSYTGTDNQVYIVSLIEPASWKVGLNDVEFLINKKASMMSFPADEDFTVVMNPEMTSMNHGSPNNVSPIHIGNGRYKGVVNYTMTGDWRLHLALSKNGTVIVADAYVDILF